ESTEILRPISYEINFSSPFYNPLQLVYGWKEKIMDERGIFYRIGPFVKLVLKPRKNLRKDNKELIIEGQIIGNLSSNYSVIMEIYAEMNLLCQYQLPLGNNFSIMVYLPKNFGINRAVEFLIAWRVIDSNGASIIPEVGDEVFPLISRILWN
ncbi:MAG: hypothetical protein QXU67_06430, partial [Candidatus Bathyarchaeia archaeon]